MRRYTSALTDLKTNVILCCQILIGFDIGGIQLFHRPFCAVFIDKVRPDHLRDTHMAVFLGSDKAARLIHMVV